MPEVELAQMVPRLEPVGPLRGGSMGKTRLMHDPESERHVVHKKQDRGNMALDLHGARAEVAASWVGQAVELPAPTAILDPDAPNDSVYMQYVVGDVAASSLRTDLSQGFFPTQARADSDDGLRMGLMDALMVNSDRHPGNWLMSGIGRLVPIDHGESFESYSRENSDGEILPKRSFRHAGFTPPFVDFSSPDGTQWKQSNPLHPDDVPVLRARLEALQPRFAQLGFGYQHAEMMRRFEAIAKRARGTRRLIV